MPSASSRGPSRAQEAVPRSRGGVPMATEQKDGVQEKRKAEDGEREMGEEIRDKKNKTGKEEERGSKEECG